METKQPKRHTFSGGSDAKQYDHEVLDISRVVRVVKGGRRFRFRAAVVIGDRSGKVGFGIGKSRDIQQAISKAQEQAAKHMVMIKIKEGTIPHTVRAKFKGADVMLKPAKPGTGMIAGGTIRVVADLAGIRDLVSKAYGSSNRISNVHAILKALSQLQDI